MATNSSGVLKKCLGRDFTFSVLLAASFSSMLGMGIISPFLPEFAKQHGANGFWMGMVFAGFGISRGLIMPFVGRLSDRTGRKIFVTGGLFIFTVISLFYPRSSGVVTLTIIRMVHGLSAGMILPIVMAYAGDLSEAGKEGATTAVMSMMFYMGLAAGPLLGGFISKEFGTDAVFYTMSALGAATLAFVAAFLPDIKNASIDMEAPRVRDLVKYSGVKALLISAMMTTLIMAVFLSFFPSLGEEINIDVNHIGIILAVGIFLAGIMQVPAGKIADRLDQTGKVIMVSAGTTIGMFGLFVLPFCPDFHALLLTGSMIGMGVAVTTPVLTGMSVKVGQKAGMGMWMGVFNSARSAGFALTPIIAGVILDHAGIDAVFYVFGIFTFIALAGFIYFGLKKSLSHDER